MRTQRFSSIGTVESVLYNIAQGTTVLCILLFSTLANRVNMQPAWLEYKFEVLASQCGAQWWSAPDGAIRGFVIAVETTQLRLCLHTPTTSHRVQRREHLCLVYTLNTSSFLPHSSMYPTGQAPPPCLFPNKTVSLWVNPFYSRRDGRVKGGLRVNPFYSRSLRTQGVKRWFAS